jgi:hypothetical protein
LPSLDVSGQDGQIKTGLNHRIASTVCGIIAGNVWDGFFTRTRKGASISLDDEPVLVNFEYYFHVPRPSRHYQEQQQDGQEQQEEGEQDEQAEYGGSPYMYPVVPAFEHWRFPHDHLPPGWPASSIHPCFLLTRLAWAVFPMVANFLLRGDVRGVTIKQQQGTTLVCRISNMTTLDLISILNPPRIRSQSPEKRDRPTDVDNNDNDGEVDDPEQKDNMDTRQRKRTRCDSRLLSQTSISSKTSSLSPETTTHKRRRFAALCHAVLIGQRTPAYRTDVMCCDYDAAERDSAAGLTGLKELGSASLCWACLGGTTAKDEDD